MPSARASRLPADLRRSTVKLFTVIREPNYYQPWDYGYQSTSGGSGCILPGRRILTNAHVVSNAVYVQVLKPGDTQRYTAKIEHVDHGSETALLSVEDPAFFKGTRPVSFGTLPAQRDQVAAFGFPIGGNELSITEGVVSRVELTTYTHSQRELLAMQIDAAINPGNSGGPVFKDGKLVGIAFQSYAGSNIEKSGYVVPLPVIEHFLADVKAGRTPQVPELGVYWQRLDSDAMCRYLGMSKRDSGVLITRVLAGGSADGLLKEEDVLLSVEGSSIAGDGTVAFRGQDRVGFTHLLNGCAVGDAVKLTVLRQGRRQTVKVVMKPLVALVPRPRYDRRPTYFMIAGLVFTRLTHNYIRCWDWKEVEPRFRYLYTDGLPSPEKEDVVVLSQVLAHDANVGFHRIMNAVVERINGQPIRRMLDVPAAFEKHDGAFHVVELDNHAGERSSDYHAAFGTRLVLRVADCEAATEAVKELYDIDHDRSEDLRATPGRKSGRRGARKTPALRTDRTTKRTDKTAKRMGSPTKRAKTTSRRRKAT